MSSKKHYIIIQEIDESVSTNHGHGSAHADNFISLVRVIRSCSRYNLRQTRDRLLKLPAVFKVHYDCINRINEIIGVKARNSSKEEYGIYCLIDD